ncbi:MAG: hypothetical protein ACLQQ4_11660 [Bacteroidia bacterium]
MLLKHNHSAKFISAILIFILLYGCNSSNKVVSSFSERKYTKGYFWNIPAEKPIVLSKFSSVFKQDIYSKKMLNNNLVIGNNKLLSKTCTHNLIEAVQKKMEHLNSNNLTNSVNPLNKIERIENNSQVTNKSTEKNDSATDAYIVSKVFIVLGCILLLLSLLAQFSIFFPQSLALGIFIVGLFLLVIGIANWIRVHMQLPPSTVENKKVEQAENIPKKRKWAWGIGAFICGLDIILGMIFVILLALFGSGEGIGILILLLIFGAFITAVLGIILATIALFRKENHLAYIIGAALICAVYIVLLLITGSSI